MTVLASVCCLHRAHITNLWIADPPLPLPPSREASPFLNSSRHATPGNLAPQSEARGIDMSPFSATSLIEPRPQAEAQDPMAALFAMLGESGAEGSVPSFAATAPSGPDTNPSSAQWPFILLRIVFVTLLALFFAFWMEPKRYESLDLHGLPTSTRGERWSELARHPSDSLGGMRLVVCNKFSCMNQSSFSCDYEQPFFWSFVALQASLRSLQLFMNPQPRTMPLILSLALPHLPKHVAAIVSNGLGYMDVASELLDDIAAAIVVVGGLVWISARS